MKKDVEIVLKNLIEEYGKELCNDKIRLKGLLMDLCSQYEREVRILIKVLDTYIMSKILNGTKKEIDEYDYNQLVNELHNNFDFTKEDALWAIDTWLKSIDFKYQQTAKNNGVLKLQKNKRVKSKITIKIKYVFICFIIGTAVWYAGIFFTPTQVKNVHLSINIGDYIEFGKYNGSPILWRVINKDVNGYMIFSEKIICFKAFDASGDKTDGRGDDDRIGFGSNYWEKSNLRQWLNSHDREVKYSSQLPDRDHVSYNSYDKQPGFLYNFTYEERNSIREVTHRCILAHIDKEIMEGGRELYKYNTKITDCIKNYDSSYYKNVTDKVFLLSTKEVKNFVYDRTWQYKKSSIEDNSISWYWLRTPSADYSDIVRAVGEDGIYGDNANDGTGGVAPVLYLKSEVTPINGEGTKDSPYRIME
ncbi:DUF6273 domain-containing protein [Clostridium sp. BJN0013]|uniref:DUF6273 domain-containing protein n=1 Tax=Clostridium sp. BJN0013 TaxID=3236840 RepID=UPI0034C67260